MDYKYRAQKRLKYQNNQTLNLTVMEEQEDKQNNEEFKTTPLKLIGCANSLNEPIGVVGDS